MANPQPRAPYGIIAHEIQENIIIRDFSEQLLKIVYLIIRLSWGCGLKAWQYNTYKDFEVIGVYKSDVAAHLNYLRNNKVIEWFEKYNLIIFNKDYDQWKIPINKKSSNVLMGNLVHESLEKSNEVRNLLTVLGKIPNEVRKNPEQEKSDILTSPVNTDTPKESIIKESINIYTADFEKFYKEYPRPEEKKRTFTNWKTQLKHYTVDQLMAACRNYKKAKAGTDRQYLKSSANFLGKEKPFEDYIFFSQSELEISGYRDLSNYEPGGAD